MTDPKKTHDEPGQDDEFDLKAETIADLDVPEGDEAEVRGGSGLPGCLKYGDVCLKSNGLN